MTWEAPSPSSVHHSANGQVWPWHPSSSHRHTLVSWDTPEGLDIIPCGSGLYVPTTRPSSRSCGVSGAMPRLGAIILQASQSTLSTLNHRARRYSEREGGTGHDGGRSRQFRQHPAGKSSVSDRPPPKHVLDGVTDIFLPLLDTHRWHTWMHRPPSVTAQPSRHLTCMHTVWKL